MTDGPFKNLKLGSLLKRFAEAVLNDAVDPSERTDLANRIIVNKLVTGKNIAIIKGLEALAQQGEINVTSIEAFFGQRPKPPFIDKFQSELTYRLNDGIPFGTARPDAIKAAVLVYVGETRNRFEEEYIRLREVKKLNLQEFQSAIERVNVTFNAVDIPKICKAVHEGDKSAFKATTNKKEGLDEGPSL